MKLLSLNSFRIIFRPFCTKISVLSTYDTISFPICENELYDKKTEIKVIKTFGSYISLYY